MQDMQCDGLWQPIEKDPRQTPTFEGITLDKKTDVRIKHPEQSIGLVDSDTLHVSVIDTGAGLSGLENSDGTITSAICEGTFDIRNLVRLGECEFHEGTVRPAISVVHSSKAMTVQRTKIRTTGALNLGQGTRLLNEDGGVYHETMKQFQHAVLGMEQVIGLKRVGRDAHGNNFRPHTGDIDGVAKLWNTYSGSYMAELFDSQGIPGVYFSRDRSGDEYVYHSTPQQDAYTLLSKRMRFTAPLRRIGDFVNLTQLSLHLQQKPLLFDHGDIARVVSTINTRGDDVFDYRNWRKNGN